MVADGGILAQHISRNEENRQFTEDDRETLLMHVRKYISLSRPGAPSQDLEKYLRKLGKDSKKSVLGQIMNHEETVRYLLTLYEFRPHFNYNAVYSMAWIKATLHNVGGGVIKLYYLLVLTETNSIETDYHECRRVSCRHLAHATVATRILGASRQEKV